ncbi:MAG: family 2 glycosyl transferase [Candidatus Peribacteria bacterium]|nr:family 2 glycosyl transferase [Candidatus Peribacteria bacterium]
MPATLSSLVPVYNEERTLKMLMQALSTACPDAEIVYVDDGSTDASLSIMRANARPSDKVIAAVHAGKGSAIRHGLMATTGEYTVIQDADLEYDPYEITLLLQKAREHPGSAVFGSRFLRPNPNIYKRFLMGNKTLTTCLNILYGSHLTDSYTCYKLLPTHLFQQLGLMANGFELEAEICAKCIRSHIPIHEVAISYHPRRIEEGKKIRFSDAWKGLIAMVRLRFF